MFGMEEKRPLIGKYGVNPFIKAGEFHAFVRKAGRSLDGEVAAQKAAAEAGR
jgi:metallo-beta-lactamase class B